MKKSWGFSGKRGGVEPPGRVHGVNKDGGTCVWITSESFGFVDLAKASVAVRWSLCDSKIRVPR